MVQWLRLHAAGVGGMGLTSGWGTKIPHATGHGQKYNFFKKIEFVNYEFSQDN